MSALFKRAPGNVLTYSLKVAEYIRSKNRRVVVINYVLHDLVRSDKWCYKEERSGTRRRGHEALPRFVRVKRYDRVSVTAESWLVCEVEARDCDGCRLALRLYGL